MACTHLLHSSGFVIEQSVVGSLSQSASVLQRFSTPHVVARGQLGIALPFPTIRLQSFSQSSFQIELDQNDCSYAGPSLKCFVCQVLHSLAWRGIPSHSAIRIVSSERTSNPRDHSTNRRVLFREKRRQQCARARLGRAYA